MELEILTPGEQNPHAGPDFFNSRLRLEQMIWAGNVEVHRLASDWYRHGHHPDPAYNNVILHVVGEYDTDVCNSLGRRIPTFVPEYNARLFNRYDVLKRNESWLPCSAYIRDVPSYKLKYCLSSLHKERIAKKCQRLEKIRGESGKISNDEALYLALASGYGLPVNSLPFEMLVKRTRFRKLIEYRDSLPDLEAVLFGHSGMLLPAREVGSYPSALWSRYAELKHLLTDRPVPPHLWKFLRLRPPSFPTLRISQFASLIHSRFPLAGNILDADSMTEVEQLFRSGASEYWNTHYLFGKSSPFFPKYPGEQFISTLIINVIIPFLSALEKEGHRSGAGIRAGEILFQQKTESNQIIKNWNKCGIKARNAMESQALLQLYNVYCKRKRCRDCRIASYIMEAAISGKK